MTMPIWILAAGLGGALLYASASDLRSRTIPNQLNAAIALAAPLWWLAWGLPLWPGVAMQLGFAVVMFMVFAAMFAVGAMGGGDVKLIAALTLWLPPGLLPAMLMVMAFAGLALTIAMFVLHARRTVIAGGALGTAWARRRAVAVPYGVAIAIGGAWALSRTLF